MNIIHSFHLEDSNAWSSVSLAQDRCCGLLGYSDPVASASYRRFLHRDLSLVALCMTYAVGSLYFDFVAFDYGAVARATLIGGGWLAGVACLVDIALHYRQRRKVTGDGFHSRISRWRQVLQIIMSFGIVICTSLASVESYANCDDIVVPVLAQEERISSYQKQEQCINSINPWIINSVGVNLIVFSHAPILLMPTMVFGYILIFVGGGLLYGVTTPLVLGIKLFIYISASTMAFLLSRQKHHDSRVQFELAVEVKRGTQDAARRENQIHMLLSSMMPKSALKKLNAKERVVDYAESASVLFGDMKSFTTWSATRTASEVAMMLNELVMNFDLLADRFGVNKVKTVGDAYWAVCGLPDPNERHAHAITDFAQSMLEVIDHGNDEHHEWEGIEWRIAVNSGPLHGGILGSLRLSYEVYGETSDLAVAAEAQGHPSRVVITKGTAELLELNIEEHDIKELKIELDEDLVIVTYVLPRGRTVKEIKERLDVVADEPISSRSAESRSTPLSLRSVSRSLSKESPSILPPIVDMEDIRDHANFIAERIASNSTWSKAGSSRSQALSRNDSSPSLHRIGSLASFGGISVRSLAMTNNSQHTTSSALIPKGNILRPPPLIVAASPAEGTDDNRPSLLPSIAEKQEDHHEGSGHTEPPDGSDSTAPEHVVHTDEALDDIATRYSKRKYKHFFLDFAESAIEAQYREFVRKDQLPMRRTARIGLLGFLCVTLLSIGIQGGPFSLISKILFAVAGVSGIVDVFLCRANTKDTIMLQVMLHHLTAVSYLVASALMPGYGSTATNDSTYLHPLVMYPVYFGNVGVVSCWLLVVVNLFGVAPLFALFLRTVPLFGTHVTYLLISNIFVVASVIILEKRSRQQFLERQVAAYFHELQAQRSEQQATVLEAIVPVHAIEPLLNWFSNGMPRDDIIADRYPNVCVAFVRLAGNTSEIDSEFSSSISSLPTPVQRTPRHRRRVSVVADGISAIDVDEEGRSIEFTDESPPRSFQKQGSLVMSRKTSTNSMIGSGDRVQVAKQIDWLDELHTQVDEIIRRSRNIDKIKTIGSDVMIAGSFYPDCSPGIAALEMMEVIFEIKKLMNGASAGVHVGELVGAVLGSSRLCFDVFGDTVNVASRAMTSSQNPGEVIVTSDFYALYAAARPRSPGSRSHTLPDGKPPRPIHFGNETHRSAKGRGYLAVRTAVDGSSDANADLGN